MCELTYLNLLIIQQLEPCYDRLPVWLLVSKAAVPAFTVTAEIAHSSPVHLFPMCFPARTHWCCCSGQPSAARIEDLFCVAVQL